MAAAAAAAGALPYDLAPGAIAVKIAGQKPRLGSAIAE
jgi:hypothetical protein